MPNNLDPKQFGAGEYSRNPEKWGPATHGYMPGYGPVTVQNGVGQYDGHTLIADGHPNEQAFNAGHDHYNGQGGGAPHRLHYNGPGR